MDETYLIKGIVLKREPFRENDHRVIIYSEERGKLELVTRGSKKITSKLASHIEPVTFGCYMVVKGRQFNYVGAARSEDCYVKIKDDPERIEAVGSAFNFFLKHIKEGQVDTDNYNLLKNFLEILNNLNFKTKFASFLAKVFILKTLSLFGYQPELHNCVECKKKIETGNNRFDFLKGGLVCSECVKNMKVDKDCVSISNNSIKLLRIIIKENIVFFAKKKVTIDKKTLDETGSLIKNFAEYIR